MTYATMSPDFTVQLPADVAKQFKPSDRFIVISDGDTLILKRVLPPITDIVGNAGPDEPLSLDEINDIVHEVKRHIDSTGASIYGE